MDADQLVDSLTEIGFIVYIVSLSVHHILTVDVPMPDSDVGISMQK